MDTVEQVRQYILENFMYSDNDDDLVNDLSLFDEGVIDSTGVLELVGYIEETFEIQVDDTELVPDNFDSVDKIVAYITRKIAEA